MYIVFGIILIFVLIYQNSRINKLESLIKSGKAPSSTPPTPVPAASIPEASVPQTAPVRSQYEIENSVPAVVGNPASEEETSGKLLGRIGIAAVVLGMGFFLKYAFDNNWVGPAGRVMIGILIGIFVMSLGQWLRKKYENYADLLVGGGMAILYLSIYSAYGFYHLIDPMAAFMGMIVVTAAGVFLSIMSATMTLSMIALIGGFLTPFIIGPQNLGSGIIFTYITILNAGILGISIYKKWSPLVMVGLIGSWLYFGWWYATSYNQNLLIPTLLFLLVQFLIFNASSIIKIVVEKLKATEVDYMVLLVTALSFGGMCYHMLMPMYKHYVSIGAVLVAVFYLIIALIAYKENPEDRTLNIFLPGLSVAFLTVAVPIEFSGPWIAAWWFVEALVLYIIASTSSSRGYQVMGVIVYILGLLDLIYYIATYVRPAEYTVFFNGPFIMLVMATAVAYAIAFTYYRYGSISTEIQKRGIVFFVVVANILTLYAISSQIIAYYELQGALSGQNVGYYSRVKNLSNTTVSIFWALYAAILTIIGFTKRHAAPRRMGLILFLITAFKVVVDVWSLGELYRIISFIVFGIIALTVSFIYVRFKDRLKEIV